MSRKLALFGESKSPHDVLSENDAATLIQSRSRGTLARHASSKMRLEREIEEAKASDPPPLELRLYRAQRRDASELRERGYLLRHLWVVGYTKAELESAGFTEDELSEAGCEGQAFVASGDTDLASRLGPAMSAGAGRRHGQGGPTVADEQRGQPRSKRRLSSVATGLFRKKQTHTTIAVTAVEAMIENRRKELRWRSPREYCCRQVLAWAFAFGLLLLMLLLSFIYALKYQEAAMQQIMLGWLFAYGVTFAVVEPVQIVLLAAFPASTDDTKTGRCVARCRLIYNELLAP